MSSPPEDPKVAVPMGTHAHEPLAKQDHPALEFIGTLAKALAAIVLGLVAVGVAGSLLIGGLVMLTCSK
jgi:hypothetical protein